MKFCEILVRGMLCLSRIQRLGISSSSFFSAFRNLSRLLQLIAW